MAQIIGSPSRYVQGRGELANLRQHTEKFGKNIFVLVSESGKKRVAPAIDKSFEGTDAKVVYESFNGECSRSEIDRITAAFKASGCDMIVGIGGGTTAVPTALVIALAEIIALCIFLVVTKKYIKKTAEN